MAALLQFLDILLKPDNIPIAGMLVLVMFFTWVGFKQDAVPGHEIPLWFKITKTGKYEIPCAELCGFGHSGMRGWLVVHPQDEYAAWAADNKAGPMVAVPASGS